MNSQAIIRDLVKSVVVKEENFENVVDGGSEYGQVLNGLGIKQERFDPEDNSDDSTCCNGSEVKTEVNYNSIINDDRISSDGDEINVNEGTTLILPTINGTCKQNIVETKEHSDSAQSRRVSNFRNVQEVQDSFQIEDDLFECDMCGSFFPEDELRIIKHKSGSSAGVCPMCRNLADEKRSLHQDVATPNTSSPTCRHPCSEKWPGLYNFSFQVEAPPIKPYYHYSSVLNKLYTTMNSPIHIQFNCQWGEPDLYVRAVPIFLQEVREPVIRCTHHMRPSEETNVGFPFSAHVIRCEHDVCSYEIDESSGRLSVVAPLGIPPPGSDNVTILYKFMCSTSCLGGMNRRPIQVVFTLERQNKEVVGRATLQVRVCSCPVRDMKKEEERLNLSRESPTQCSNIIPESLRSRKSCKKPRLVTEDGVNYIPLWGDRKLVRKALELLRSNLIGEKLAAGLELTEEDKMNWKIFNKLISDDAGPSER